MSFKIRRDFTFIEQIAFVNWLATLIIREKSFMPFTRRSLYYGDYIVCKWKSGTNKDIVCQCGKTILDGNEFTWP